MRVLLVEDDAKITAFVMRGFPASGVGGRPCGQRRGRPGAGSRGPL